MTTTNNETWFRTHVGTVFRACNAMCAEGFKTDRRTHLIYGPYMKRSGGFYMNAEEWSRMERVCAYCNKPIPQ